MTLQLKPGTFRDRYPFRDPYPVREPHPFRNRHPFREPYPFTDPYPSREPHPLRDRHPFRDPYPLRDPHPSSVSVSAVEDGRNATSPWGRQDLRDEFLRRAAYFLLLKDRTGTPPKIQLGSLEF